MTNKQTDQVDYADILATIQRLTQAFQRVEQDLAKLTATVEQKQQNSSEKN